MIEAYLLHLLILICIYAILSMSLTLLTGYTGMLNLGHAAFFAIGAYASVLLVMAGFPFWLGFLAAGGVAALFGVLLSIPSLRLRGDFLAIATLAFGEIIRSIMLNWTELTRGPLGIPGIPKPELFGIVFDSMLTYFVLTIVVVLATYVVLKYLLDGKFGIALKAIRENELIAESLGKDVKMLKMQAFAISALFAGFAGSLFAHYITFIDPSSFTLSETVLVLLMVVLGGLGSLVGSIAGAIILILLPEPLRFIGLPSSMVGQLRQIIYAGLLIVLIIKRPKGLFGEQWFGGIVSDSS
ncbi:MAG: branched-chain amino acid ABC transporter permease [archaeon]|jgi:branched-chain amino acid transport system permease protein|nr:branched-chain amino acid ABC transporter permease [archaeon]